MYRKNSFLLFAIIVLLSFCTEKYNYLNDVSPYLQMKKPEDNAYYIDRSSLKDSGITFNWNEHISKEKYIFQIAKDVNFEEIVISKETAETEVNIPFSEIEKHGENTFYWRCKNLVGEFDQVRKFHYLPSSTFYVASTENYSSDSYSGTKNEPLIDIQEAIDRARLLNIKTIAVSEGSYSFDVIRVYNNISIIGGYSYPDWMETDDNSNTVFNGSIASIYTGKDTFLKNFTISNTNSSNNSAVKIYNSELRLENLNINLYHNDKLTLYGIEISKESSPVLNNISVNVTNENGEAFAVNVTNGSSPLFEECLITSKGCGTFIVGIRISDDSEPVIKNNTVISASSGCSSTVDGTYYNVRGIDIQSVSKLTLEDSFIKAYSDNVTLQTAGVTQSWESTSEIHSCNISSEGGKDTHAIFLQDKSSAVIEESYFTGRNAEEISIGIFLGEDASAVIQNNYEIKGEKCSGSINCLAVGLFLSYSAYAEIKNNKLITGIDAANLAAGISLKDSSSALISGNERIEGKSSGGTSRGIEVASTMSSTIEKNFIYASDAAEFVNGIAVFNNGNAIIKNNPIIFGNGPANEVSGIYLGTSEAVTIVNNNIRAYNSPNEYRQGIAIVKTNLPIIINNIVFHKGSTIYPGVYEYDQNSDPAVFENNLIYGFGTAYYDEGNNHVDPSDVDVAPVCSGNVVNVNPSFVDDNISNADYHLSPETPAEIKFGGKNTCGTSSEGDVCDDADGNARTEPVSIGAYELD